MPLDKFCKGLPKQARPEDDLSTDAGGRKESFFAVVDRLFTKQSIKTDVSPYPILRAISMDSSLLPICASLAKYIELDKDLFYTIARGVLPVRNRFGFFKYLKKVATKNEDVIQSLAEHFFVNRREAALLLEILIKENIKLDDIRDFFGLSA